VQTSLNGRISLAIAIVDIDWTAVSNDSVVTTNKFMKMAAEKAIKAARMELSKSRSG
jgi:hypothetical protein